jgi:excisionase family DNA binding protein
MAPLSSDDVARLVGVHRSTLERWIKEGRVSRPSPFMYGRQKLRLWAKQDIENLREYKVENYNKKPRRKKAARTKAKRSKS